MSIETIRDADKFGSDDDMIWADDSTTEGAHERIQTLMAALPFAVEADVRSNVLGRLERAKRSAFQRGFVIGTAAGATTATIVGILFRMLG